MEDRGRLPGLPALVRGCQRRRDRRPGRARVAARLPRAARRRRDLAVAGLSLAAGRQRLRHLRLPGHRAGVRDAGGVRPAAGRDPRARDEAGDGPRGQPHLVGTSVVRGVARVAREPEARLVLVARRAAQRLALGVLRLGVGARRDDRAVLPAHLRPLAARSELGERDGAGGRLLDDALVAGPRRRRLPDGRHQLHLEGPLGRVHLRAADPRVHARDARGGVRGARGADADGRRDARSSRSRTRSSSPTRRGARSTWSSSSST